MADGPGRDLLGKSGRDTLSSGNIETANESDGSSMADGPGRDLPGKFGKDTLSSGNIGTVNE
jgi:hypothetical protein